MKYIFNDFHETKQTAPPPLARSKTFFREKLIAPPKVNLSVPLRSQYPLHRSLHRDNCFPLSFRHKRRHPCIWHIKLCQHRGAPQDSMDGRLGVKWSVLYDLFRWRNRDMQASSKPDCVHWTVTLGFSQKGIKSICLNTSNTCWQLRIRVKWQFKDPSATQGRTQKFRMGEGWFPP